MIRAETRGSVNNSPRAIAYAADGATYNTKPIVSKEVYPIRRVFNSGGFWAAQFDRRPKNNTTTLEFRIVGCHARSLGAHPLDADGVPVTRDNTDPTIFVTNIPWDDGHWFVEGYAFKAGTIFDASRELAKLGQWCEDHQPVIVELPLGCLVSKDVFIYFPSSTSIIGAGGARTFMIKADFVSPETYINQMVRTGNGTENKRKNVTDLLFRGFTIYGNPTRARPVDPVTFAYVGGGVMALGADANTDSIDTPLNMRLEDVHVKGAGGYGIYFGADNIKQHIYVGHCTVVGCKSDNIDFKDKPKQNRYITVEHCRFGWHGMGSTGTNLAPVFPMPTNALITVAGTTQVKFRWDINPGTALMQRGEVITFSDGTGGDGVSNVNVSCPVVGKDATYLYVDTGQTVTTGGVSIGGSSLKGFAPKVSDADSMLDCRGEFFSVLHCEFEGPLFSRVALKQRPESGGSNDGSGGKYMVADDIKIVDRSPPWIASSTNKGEALELRGDYAKITNLQIVTEVGTHGIRAGAFSTEANISKFHIIGCDTPIEINGERIKLRDGIIKNWVGTNPAIYVFGDNNVNVQMLPENPFRTVVGQPEVYVDDTINPHGLSNGDQVNFVQATSQAGGVVILNRAQGHQEDNFYTVTVDGPTSFHFTATEGVGANTTPFGGPTVTVIYPQTRHVASDNEIDGVVLIQENETVAATAVGIHLATGPGENPDPIQTVRTKIRNCGTVGYPLGTPVRDFTSDTIWGPGNYGQWPNLQPGHALAAGTESISLLDCDSGKLYGKQTSATGTSTLTLPDSSKISFGWWVDLASDSSNSSYGITISAQGSDNIIDAGSAVTSRTSTTRGAYCRVRRRSSGNGYMIVNKGGTWS